MSILLLSSSGMVAAHQVARENVPTAAPPQVMYDAQVMRDILAPMSAAEFFHDYYLKEPVHIHRANNVPLLFRQMFSSADLDAALLHGRESSFLAANGAFSLKSSNGTSLDQVLPAPQPGDVGGGDVGGKFTGNGNYTRRLLEDGTTLRLSLESINPTHLPAGTRGAFDSINVMLGGANISDASRMLGDGINLEDSEFRSRIHIYTTGPQAGARGLNPHTDTYDVFILQLEGSKQWTVCTPPLPQAREAAAPAPAADAPPFAKVLAPASSSPHPPSSSTTTIPTASSAERAELHLQAQHKSDQCTFYTDESLAALDCSQFVMEAGDTYYMPKGLVHFAASTGTTSLHATVSLDRTHSTWFDLVLDELVRTDAAASSGDDSSMLRWDADALEELVQSTLLGVHLAQLVPVGAAKLLQSHDGSAGSADLERVLEQHLDALVAEVIALTQSSQGTAGAGGAVHVKPNSADGAAAYPLQWLKNAVAASLPFASSAAGAHDRIGIAHRIARLKKGVTTFGALPGEGVRKRRSTSYTDRTCNDKCDTSCILVGLSCDQECDGGCTCNAGHGSKSCDDSCDSGCVSLSVPGSKGCDEACDDSCSCKACSSTQYRVGAGDGACITRIGCNAGSYWADTNTSAKGTCKTCPVGTYSSTANVLTCKTCPLVQCSTEQYLVGSCGGTTSNKQCLPCQNVECTQADQVRTGTCASDGSGFACSSCENAACAQEQYRAGTCGNDGKGYICQACDNLQCTGEHEYRAGSCGGSTTPTANAYTCDTHEPCPKDTEYIPSDTTHRTCPQCPPGQHQPLAAHRQRNCIDTTTSTVTTSTLLDNGTTIEELLEGGMQVDELIEKGFALLELVQAPGANITVEVLEDAGVPAVEIAVLRTTLVDLENGSGGSTGAIVAVVIVLLLLLVLLLLQGPVPPAAASASQSGPNYEEIDDVVDARTGTSSMQLADVEYAVAAEDGQQQYQPPPLQQLVLDGDGYVEGGRLPAASDSGLAVYAQPSASAAGDGESSSNA
eukprot:gene445-31467_t